MSIKDLFQNSKTKQILKVKTLESASAEIEGVDYLKNKTKEKEEFVPPIDFSTASNFAKFGSAEMYYQYAFERIQQQYPYDGRKAEIQEFENESTYLDRYIFDNVYPRFNGFINLSPNGLSGGTPDSDGYYSGSTNKEYIYVLGGPHTASGGMTGKKLHNTFDKSTLHDPTNRRTNNLEFDFDFGNTIEFWMKKSAFASSEAHKEVVFDVTNQIDSRVTLILSASSDPVNLLLTSGSTISTTSIASSDFTTASIADDNWHHYAVSMKTSSSGILCRFFVDAQLENETYITDSPINEVKPKEKGVIASIGAKVTSSLGDGQIFSASFDEFRFWKKERSGKQIGQNWFTHVGGGTDDSTDNVDLGIYFKFNEGIVGSIVDETVIDYSGRLSNGSFIGYSTSYSRNTGSAIVLAGAATKEFKDPTIYSTHPDYISKIAEYKLTGSIQDDENSGLMINYFPSWLIDEDGQNGEGVKKLVQMMASYFDTLYSQISYLNKMKDPKYFGPTVKKDEFSLVHTIIGSDNDKPHPFSQNLLRNKGFIVPNLFVEANIVEEFLEHDKNQIYEKDIERVRDLIYQNIYNNLEDIYKSKGTRKSFTRLLKNFGINEDLIRLNLYADQSTYLLRDNYDLRTDKSKAINNNHSDNFGGTVVQSASSDSTGFIKTVDDDQKYGAFTLEGQFLIPSKPDPDSENYFITNFHTSSLMGFHRIDESAPNVFHSDDKFLVVKLASTNNKEHSHFVLSGSDGIYLTSSVIPNLYDNQLWTIGVKVKNSKYPQTNIAGATTEDVNIEFYGVTSENVTKYSSFSVSSESITSGSHFLSSSKKVFIGAEKENFTGSLITYSDVKTMNVRFWLSELSNEELDSHSYYGNSYTSNNVLDNDSPTLLNSNVPKLETLALHWNFSQNTGSDSNGSFLVIDESSGSTDQTGSYGWISQITKNRHDGRGYDYDATDNNNTIDFIYFSDAKRIKPDAISLANSVTIKDFDETVVFQDDEVADNFYSFEKSMQAVISDEMLNMFATVKDFNKLIGDMKEKYRTEYKDLKFLKRKFFEKIENEPDQERFFEFYKWIDSSVSFAIRQLYPASARFSEGILDVVESHVLERNKYQQKFPMLSDEVIKQGTILGAEEMAYNWRLGHSPEHDSTKNQGLEHCTWQKERREDTDGSDEEALRVVVNTKVYLPKLILKTDGDVHYSRQDDIRRFRPRPYVEKYDLKPTIHGGTNYQIAKNRDLHKDHIRVHGETNASGIPQNVLVVGVGEGQGLVADQYCKKEANPNQKVKYSFKAIIGKNSNNDGTGVLDDEYSYVQLVKGQQHFPFNLVSQSVNTGYNQVIYNTYTQDAVLTNLHADTTYLSNDEPMQGPFTRRHVGGHQSRHTKINKYNSALTTTNKIDDEYVRPESFRILIGDHPDASVKDGALGMVGPDYGGPYPDPTRQWSIYYRDERAKRPVNIKNIQHDSDSSVVGNYRNNYEVISSFGRKGRNLRFNSLQDNVDFVETTLFNQLAGTNVNAGLFAQKASNNGSVFLNGTNDPNFFREGTREHDNPVESSHEDNKTTKSIITTKFSAPGGPEVMTPIFLDAIDQELSPYNSMNHRNSAVRFSGSGEVGSVRVDSHLGKREGLLTNLRRHTGQFGVDSVHGAGTIVKEGYSTVPGLHKQHRNNRFKPKDYEFYTGALASGSFEVQGMSFSGSFATASFVVTGATIYGLNATGAFNMSGAYYGGQQASASFKVIGRNIQGTVSSDGVVNAVSAMKGSGSIFVGSQATGSFTIPSATTVGTVARAGFTLPQRFVPGVAAAASFSLNGRTIYGVNSSGSFSITGSTDPAGPVRSSFELEVDSPSRFGDRFAAVYYLDGTVASENVSSKQTNGTSTYGMKIGSFHIGQNTDGTDTNSTGNDRRINLWETAHGQLFQGGADGSGGGGASDTSWTSFTTAVPTYDGSNINQWNTENEVESTGTGTLISFWIKFDATNAFNTAISNNSNNTLFRFKNSSDEDSFIVYIYKDASGNFDLRIRKFWDENDGAGAEGFTSTTYANFFNSSNYGDANWYHIVISHHNYSYVFNSSNANNNGNTHMNGANVNAANLNGQTAVDGTHIWVNGSSYTTSRTLYIDNNIVDPDRSGIASSGYTYSKGSRPRSVSRFAIKHYGANFGSLGQLNVMLDDLFIFDEGYQPARYYDSGTSRWIDTTNWSNGSHQLSTNGSNSDVPTPAQLYNSGKFLSYSDLTSLSDNALVAAYMMDEGSSESTLVAINNSDQNLTINDNVSRVSRSDSFSGTNHRSSTDVFNDLSSSVDYVITQLGGGYAAQFLTASNGDVGLRLWFTGSNSTDTSQGDKRSPSFTDEDSTYGFFRIGGRMIPTYEPRSTGFDVSDTITVNSSQKTIRHFSYADKGDINSFGSISAPTVTGKNYSTRGLRWDSEASGTDYGPILYNTNFAYLSDDEDYMSTSFWIRLKDNVSNTKYIITLWQDSGDATPSTRACFVYVSYDNLYIRFYDKSGNYRQHEYNDVLSTDRYTHVHFTVTRTHSGNEPIVFINGSSVSRDSTSTSATSPTGRMQNVNSVFIGDYPSDSAAYEHKGWLTQMVFWNGSLSGDNAKEVFNKGRWKWMWSHPLASNIFAWYQLGDDAEVPSSDDPPNALGETDYGSTALNTSETLLSISSISNDHWKGAGSTDNLNLTIAVDSLIYVSHGIVKEEVNHDADYLNEGGNSFNSNNKFNDGQFLGFSGQTYGFLNEVTGVIKATYGDFSYSIIGTPDYDNDTIRVTHDSNNAITSTSNVSATSTTFNNVDSNFSGYNRNGLSSGDLITISGETFEFYTGSDASIVQGGNRAVQIDTDSTTWNNLKTAIIGATNFDTITIDETYGTKLALFSITSSVEAPSEVNDIVVPTDGVVVNGSIATIVNQTNAGVVGQYESRDPTEDYLRIRDDNSTDYHYIRLYSGDGSSYTTTTTTRYVPTDIWSTDVDFWNRIETEFGNLANSWVITNNDDGTFDLQAPAVGTSYNGKEVDKYSGGGSSGFITAVDFAGGSANSGINDNTSFTITADSDTYRVDFDHTDSTSIGASVATIKVSGSSITNTGIWDNVETALSNLASSNTDFTCTSNDDGTFTIVSDNTGSFTISLSANPNSVVSSYSQTAAGSSESGAPDGGTFTINGVVFEYSASLPAGSGGGNVVIDSDVSQATFRTNVSNAITGSSLGPNVIVSNSGDDFTLTARNVGAAYNYGITQNNASLGSLLGMAGGQDPSGATNGDSFTLNSVVFQVTNGSPAASTDLTDNPFYIAATGSDVAYWNRIVYGINNHANTFFSASYSGTGLTRIFALTGSVTGSSNNGQPSATSGPSFEVTTTSSGGTNESGVKDGHRIRITSQATPSYNTHIFELDLNGTADTVGTNYVSASASSDTAFWNGFLTEINSVLDNSGDRQVTASYSDNGDGTATFTINTTASTTSWNGNDNASIYIANSSHTASFTEVNGDTTPFGTFHRFAGGINSSGSQPGDTIQIAGTTITLVSASAVGNQVKVVGRPDAELWEDLRSKINSNISNWTATTGSESGGLMPFEVSFYQTGSGNSPSISETGTSFSSIVNFDGANELGADDPHSIVIDSVIFEVSNEIPAGQQSGSSIMVSASNFPGQISNATFWNNMSSAMNTNLTNFDVTYYDNGNGTATFQVSSSNTGSAYNVRITSEGHTFTNVPAFVTGGVDGFTGAEQGDTLKFFRKEAASELFIYAVDLNNSITDSGVQKSPSLSAISSSITTTNYVSKNLEFWGVLTQSIADNTVYDSFTITPHGLSASISFTASVTGSLHNGCIFETGSTFTINTSTVTGGVTYEEIPGTNYQRIYDNAYVVTQLPATDFQYSWTNKALTNDYNPTGSSTTGSNTKVLRYADKTGLTRIDNSIFNSIGFPSSSIFTFN